LLLLLLLLRLSARESVYDGRLPAHCQRGRAALRWLLTLVLVAL